VSPGAADLEAVGAGAETAGAEVRVAPGHWRPDLPLGRALLAHELTHVAQQGAAPRLGPGRGGYGVALSAARAERPSAALAARGASLAEPAAASLTPAPRGMRQRTVSCAPTKQGPPPVTPTPSPPKPTAPKTPAPDAGKTPVTPPPAPTPAPATTAAPVGDWDFTPADYGALKKGGGALSFAPGSEWFPEPLRKNLLATLVKLLDPKLSPTATAGVNVKDFYHGHVLVPVGKFPAGHFKANETYNKELDSRVGKALGGQTFDPVTAGNLEAFRQALKEVQPFATKVLTPVLTMPGAVVLYHTFELSGPRMQPGDPRRNWMTPLDTNTPAGYSPPDPDNASSYGRDYNHIFQFAFLIDDQGRIHLQPGSTKQLRAVTGEPGN